MATISSLDKGDGTAPSPNGDVEFRRVSVGGLSVRVLMAGHGAPLLLLHGSEESAAEWQWLARQLTHCCRVYAADLPPTGEESAVIERRSSEDYVPFVASLMDALGVERAALGGNSLGGLIAIRSACRMPERVSSLVLISPAGLGREVSPVFNVVGVPGVAEFNGFWASTPPGSMLRVALRTGLFFSNPLRAPFDWLSEQYWLAMRPQFLGSWIKTTRVSGGPDGQRDIALDTLSEVAVPTLLVWGECDRVLPVSQGHRAKELLADCRLAVVPTCGHLPHVECPETVASEIEAFMAEL